MYPSAAIIKIQAEDGLKRQVLNKEGTADPLLRTARTSHLI